MRVVLDTNVLARAIRGGASPAAELLRLVITPPHLFVLSPFLLSELSRVLRYERLRTLHQLDDASLDRYVRSLQEAALLVTPVAGRLASVVANDPDDDPIVAAAIAGRADVLCTLDRHLHAPPVVSFCRHHKVQVLTDTELLDRIRSLPKPM